MGLWSINERLAGREGTELPLPDNDWLGDLLVFMQHDRKELAK